MLTRITNVKHKKNILEVHELIHAFDLLMVAMSSPNVVQLNIVTRFLLRAGWPSVDLLVRLTSALCKSGTLGGLWGGGRWPSSQLPTSKTSYAFFTPLIWGKWIPTVYFGWVSDVIGLSQCFQAFTNQKRYSIGSSSITLFSITRVLFIFEKHL